MFVYSNLAESGLAISMLTRCCTPAHLILTMSDDLLDLAVLDIAVVRSELQKDNLSANLLVDEIIDMFKR